MADSQGEGNGEGTRGAQYSGPVAHEPEPVHDHHDDPAYITRTKFLTGVAVVTGGVMTAAILVPVVGFAAADTLKEEKWQWVDIGPMSDFPDGKVTSIAVSGPSPSPTGAPTCATRTTRSSRSGTAAPTSGARSPTPRAATSTPARATAARTTRSAWSPPARRRARSTASTSRS